MEKVGEPNNNDGKDWHDEILAGTLMKFTNVVKGWQPRWFVLDPVKGTLRYYLSAEKSTQKEHRGLLFLLGVTVCPSEDDSLVFYVNPAEGEGFKLRAEDTRQKQLWVNRIRYVAERLLKRQKNNTENVGANKKASGQKESKKTGHGARNDSVSGRDAAVMHDLEKVLRSARDQELALHREGENSTAPHLNRHLLILKACTSATLADLEHCAVILQRNHVSRLEAGACSRKRSSGSNPGASRKTSSVTDTQEMCQNFTASELGEDALSLIRSPMDELRFDDEILDDKVVVEDDLGQLEPTSKKIILNLLSRLKLGMDLSRVSLPIFIFQGRSFLECLSDYFVPVPLLTTLRPDSSSEERFHAVLKWYLCSFYFGCHNALNRKPYNPVLREIFRCSWRSRSEPSQPKKEDDVVFLAEQVSHHPPVSAFYAHSSSSKIHVHGYVWTKSKFMGMSVQCSCIGEVVVYLENFGESYKFSSLPTAYARSILSSPWMEFGGRVICSCPQSGLNAAVVFETKPFYGGKLHRVFAETKDKLGSVICKITGEWNNSLEFAYVAGRTEIIKISSDIPKALRFIRPTELQHPRESRRLWANVTKALLEKDVENALFFKEALENHQRSELSSATNGDCVSQFFHQTPAGAWVPNSFSNLELERGNGL